ncbi:MAG: GGDEF domain-containing protein [Myxococcota bacterium]
MDARPANEPTPGPQTAGASLDEALTTLSSVLRTFGQLRFPIGEEERDFPQDSESWARHVMTGGEPPSGTRADGRDWRGVREHVRRRRVAERDYIDSRIAGFTDVIAEVVSQLQGLAGYNEDAAESISRTMGELRRVADEASLEELRAHVRRTVRGVRDAVENQRSQFSGKVRNLGERLAAVHEDLDNAREEAKLDPLTQLYTGTALEGELDRGGRVAELSGLALSLVCIHVDGFELFALNHGLEASNNVLRAVADCVSLCFFRKSDFVARVDDHRFAVLLWDTELASAERGAERLLQKVRRLRVPHTPEPLEVSVSLGVCTRKEGESRDAFMQRSLAAAEHARIGGGDRREGNR